MEATALSRSSLRSAVADYLLDHGLSGLSLRPLAAAVGTSARMLVYHFGSKDRLIAEAMNEIRVQQQRLVAEWMKRNPEASFADFLPVAWAWVSDRRHERYLRLFLELLGRGIRRSGELSRFARSTFDEWVGFVESRLHREGRPRRDARALAILFVAAVRGLALYHVATGDKRGAEEGLRAFAHRATRGKRRRG